MITASSPVSSYAASSTSEASSAWSLKVSSVDATALALAGCRARRGLATSSRRPLALASRVWPLAVSSRAMPRLGVLDRPLDGVERLAGQRGLGCDGHRRGRTDQRGGAEHGGEATVAAIRPHRQHEALLLGGQRTGGLGKQRGVGLGHQAHAEVGDELGRAVPVRGWLAGRARPSDSSANSLRVLLGERTRECRVELLRASSRRERPCHRCLPCIRRPLVATGRCPPTEQNDPVRTEVTRQGTVSRRWSRWVISHSTLPASAWPDCAPRAAGAA